MPRNAEVIRQWSILRDLESSRRLTIDDLAARTGVSTRTIRRDLEALQASGFPLYDDLDDGKRYWMLEQRPFRRLDETGFTLAELSALYFSRTLVEALAATPFHHDVRSAFDKLSSALTPGMRQFLDRLPLVLQAKAEPGTLGAGDASGSAPSARELAARSARAAQLVEATLHHRRVAMRYHSMSSDREKAYLIEPSRLVFAQGGLYVVAFVPEYGAAADVRRRSHPRPVAHRGALRAGGRCAGGGVRALARRASGHAAAAGHNVVRATHRPLRQGAGLACLAAGGGPGGWQRAPDAAGVERLGAAELDSRLSGHSRACSITAGTARRQIIDQHRKREGAVIEEAESASKARRQ